MKTLAFALALLLALPGSAFAQQYVYCLSLDVVEEGKGIVTLSPVFPAPSSTAPVVDEVGGSLEYLQFRAAMHAAGHKSNTAGTRGGCMSGSTLQEARSALQQLETEWKAAGPHISVTHFPFRHTGSGPALEETLNWAKHLVEFMTGSNIPSRHWFTREGCGVQISSESYFANGSPMGANRYTFNLADVESVRGDEDYNGAVRLILEVLPDRSIDHIFRMYTGEGREDTVTSILIPFREISPAKQTATALSHAVELCKRSR